VIRLCSSLSSLLLLTLALTMGPTTSALASGVTTYQLTNNSPAGTAPVNLVFFQLTPPNVIDETVASPFTVLPGSSGFTQPLSGGTLDATIPAGQPNAGPFQAIGLDFTNSGGFGPGAVLDFQLSLKSSVLDAPTLQLLDPTTLLQTQPDIQPLPASQGLSLVALEVANVPEPMSLALWSVLAGLGLFQVKRPRRAKTAA
jgi:hypothetical protein